MPPNSDPNWAKVLGELLADHEQKLPTVVADTFARTVVPPELAQQIKTAIHLLHESPPIVQQNAPPSASPLPPPRPSRIERTEAGGYTLIYDEPKT